MSLIGYCRSKVRDYRAKNQKRALLAEDYAGDIAPADWPGSLQDPTLFYKKGFGYFHKQLPQELRDHRNYFTQQRRAFGEDAFHVMWFLLFREFRPKSFVEIGVYRGQTVSLAALLQRHFEYAGEVSGISPFAAVGDSTCAYHTDVNYLEDTLANNAHFSLPRPHLVKGYSTDANAVALLASREWDCIYIDGNHDYEVVVQDWKNCAPYVKRGGLIVLDDSGLTTSFRPPVFSTAGIPGPSDFAKELKKDPGFQEILQVGHNRVFQKK